MVKGATETLFHELQLNEGRKVDVAIYADWEQKLIHDVLKEWAC